MQRVKRSYRAPRRLEQAARTKAAIIGAAERLLLEGGLTRTTMESIAKEANVAVQTVYATFGSKGGILAALLDRLEAEAGSHRQAGEVTRSALPLEQLRAIVRFNRRLFDRGGDIIAIAHGSAAVDSDLAANVAEGHRRRRAFQAPIVDRWATDGALRPELGSAEATDVLWAFTSPDLHRLLVGGRGWTPARYERWLTAILSSVLFGSELVEADPEPAPARLRRRG